MIHVHCKSIVMHLYKFIVQATEVDGPTRSYRMGAGDSCQEAIEVLHIKDVIWPWQWRDSDYRNGRSSNLTQRRN
jgi:hypothetical protein